MHYIQMVTEITYSLEDIEVYKNDVTTLIQHNTSKYVCTLGTKDSGFFLL